MVETKCDACGKLWINHPGVALTCAELQVANHELVKLRILFFVLCLKYLKPNVDFTPANLAKALLRKGKR